MYFVNVRLVQTGDGAFILTQGLFSLTARHLCWVIAYLMGKDRIYQWFSARLWYLQCISTGDTTVLH